MIATLQTNGPAPTIFSIPRAAIIVSLIALLVFVAIQGTVIFIVATNMLRLLQLQEHIG